MSRWFRVDDGLVDDPKVQQLPDALFRAVINLWCVTSQNGGKLPSVDQIAFKLRMGLHKTEKILDTLRRLNLIEDDDDGTRPHNWNGRQFKSDATDPTAASRSKKYRDGKRGVTDASRVTDRDVDRDAGVSVTATRADTEQIQNRTDIAADAASTGNGKYEFDHGVIRLTPKDFAKWQRAYSHLDLAAELIAIEPWASQQANWFHAVPGALTKKNRELKARSDAARAGGPQLPLTRSGNPWPEGIV